MKKLTAQQKYNMNGYIFVLPWVIGFLLFIAFPFIASIIMSLSEIKDNDYSKLVLQFNHFKNYTHAFIMDIEFVPKFIASIVDTVIKVPLLMVYALFIALILNSKIKCRGLFRMIFFLPVLLGSGYIMEALTGGNINDLSVRYLIDSDTNFELFSRSIVLSPSIANIMSPALADAVQNVLDHVGSLLIKSGIQIIIFLGGLQTIPTYLYEAAKVDGASAWERFWKITLPMLSPIILINIVFSMVDYFTSIDNEVMNYTLDTTVGSRFDVCYGSALSWIYMIFIFIMVSIVYILMRKRVANIYNS